MRKESKADDSFLYDKTENPQIDICLNCKKKKCTGNCEHTVTPKEFIIKRTKKYLNGEVKASYLHCISKDEKCLWQKDVHKAKKRTYKGALNLLEEVKKYDNKGEFEIVKYEEEVKKITEEKRKTYRGVCRFHVDANGNLLGKRG